MGEIISPCGLYRYRLERDLGGMLAGPTVAWIMESAAHDRKAHSRPLEIKQRPSIGNNAQLVCNASAMREPKKRKVRAIWCARHQDLRAVERIRALFRGHGRAPS